MDQTNDAWNMSMLGQAIGVYVDRELNKPTVIDSNTQYGMDAQGRLYTLGQPAGQVVANTSTATSKPVNGNLLLLILIGAFIASRQ